MGAIASALASFTLLPDAHAEPKIGIEARGGPMYRSDGWRGGPDLLVDFGYAIDSGRVSYPVILMPEIIVAGSFYAPKPFDGDFKTMLGLRGGFAWEVEFSAFVRGGYCLFLGPRDPAHAGTFEGGISIDKRLERSVTFGGSLGYEGIYFDRMMNGFKAGLHVGIWIQ